MYVGNPCEEQALFVLLEAINELRRAPDASSAHCHGGALDPAGRVPSHVTITLVAPHHISAHMTRLHGELFDHVEVTHGLQHVHMPIAMAARLDIIQNERRQRYRFGELVSEAVGGSWGLRAGEAALDLKVDTGLIAAGLTWEGLNMWAWRRAVDEPELRFTLINGRTGEQREIQAAEGLVSWARTRTAAPLLDLTVLEGEVRLRLVVGRLETRRGMLGVWVNWRTRSCTSGPLLAEVCRSITGPAPRERLRQPEQLGWRERRLTPPAGLLIVGHYTFGAGQVSEHIDQSGRRLISEALVAPTQAALGAALPGWREALALYDEADGC